MNAFPTLFSVTVKPCVRGPKNALNEYPKTWPEGQWRAEPVYGWAPPGADEEPAQSGRSAVIRDLDVLAPPSFSCGADDRVAVDGVDYEVVGHPDDFSHGPWGWAPGVRVHLNRVEEVGERG